VVGLFVKCVRTLLAVRLAGFPFFYDSGDQPDTGCISITARNAERAQRTEPSGGWRPPSFFNAVGVAQGHLDFDTRVQPVHGLVDVWRH